MSVRSLALLVVASAALLAAQATRAEDNMRCGSRLVSVGDGKDKVVALCGDPSSVSFEGLRSGYRYPYWPYDYRYVGPAYFELPVELWTYNFGSRKLLRKLRFVGDELVDIWTDGYGY